MEVVREGAQRTGFGKLLRQAAVLVGGGLLLVSGGVMLVLPGPGLAVILAGLGILATEYAWARRALDKGRGAIANVRGRIRPAPAPRIAA